MSKKSMDFWQLFDLVLYEQPILQICAGNCQSRGTYRSDMLALVGLWVCVGCHSTLDQFKHAMTL